MTKKVAFIFEVLGWIRIVASPFLAGLVLGVFIYFINPFSKGMPIAICIASLGLFAGIYWANRVWKKYGTLWYLSRSMATPELDNQENDNLYKKL